MAEIVKRARGRPRAFNDTSDQVTIRALDRALEILAALAEVDAASLSELAERAGEAPSTVYRVLTTLARHGMVEMDETSQLWMVGAGAFRVGSRFLRRSNLVERARPMMRALMEATDETANLGIERRGQVLFLAQVETHQSIRAFFAPGTQNAMHASGIGKALLAWYAPARAAAILARQGLERFTPRTLTEAPALAAELARVRRQGYALDDEERNQGMRCIAAPVFDEAAEPVAGLSISGPSFRLPEAAVADLGARVAEAARALTEAIGGRLPRDEAV